MSHEQKLNRAEQELEKALGQLLPQPTKINRDALMFRAGAASNRKHNRYWQSSTAILALCLCASISLSLLQTPSPTVLPNAAQRVESHYASSQPKTPHRLPANSYLELRRKVLTDGIEALPAPQPSSAIDEPAITLESLLESMSQS